MPQFDISLSNPMTVMFPWFKWFKEWSIL